MTTACSLSTRCATTLPLGCLCLWPGLPRPRMAGFEVSTEGRRAGHERGRHWLAHCLFLGMHPQPSVTRCRPGAAEDGIAPADVHAPTLWVLPELGVAA